VCIFKDGKNISIFIRKGDSGLRPLFFLLSPIAPLLLFVREPAGSPYDPLPLYFSFCTFL
jgi:hypothetical protein